MCFSWAQYMTNNDYGLFIDGTGHVVYHNTATGNPTAYYNIMGRGHHIGPIGSTTTATIPWANIEY